MVKRLEIEVDKGVKLFLMVDEDGIVTEAPPEMKWARGLNKEAVIAYWMARKESNE